MLSIIVDIIIEIAIHQDYDEKKPFTSLNEKKNKKKNESFNEEHNEKVKCDNSRKRMQYNTNNSRLENKNQNKRKDLQSVCEFKNNFKLHILILNDKTAI